MWKNKSRILFIFIWYGVLDRNFSLIKILKIFLIGFLRYSGYYLGYFFENILILIKYYGF